MVDACEPLLDMEMARICNTELLDDVAAHVVAHGVKISDVKPIKR